MKKHLILTLFAFILISMIILTSCDLWKNDNQQSTTTTTTTSPSKIRTTITEDEWKECTEKENFTIDFTSYGSFMKIKITEEAMEFIGSGEHLIIDRMEHIVLYDTGRGWSAYNTYQAYVSAYDQLSVGKDILGIFEEVDFIELTYDEQSWKYYCTYKNLIGEFSFRDGELCDMVIKYKLNSSKICDIKDIGGSNVELPQEYIIVDDGKPTPSYADESVRTTIDGDEWDDNIMGSFSIRTFATSNMDVEVKCDERAYYQRVNSLGNTLLEYFVQYDGDIYKLEYVEDKFMAMKTDQTRFPYLDEVLSSLMGVEYLMGDWEDFTYNEEGRYYECEGVYLYFEEGKLVRVTLIENNTEMIFLTSDMGTTEVVIPKYEFETNGLIYELNAEGTGYTVVGWRKIESGDIVIPETYNGKPVIAIGEEAFRGCDALTSIIIPDGVKSIGREAFKGCDALTGIIIPDGVKSIGRAAFEGCGSLESVELPNSIISIASYVFDNTKSLKFNIYEGGKYLGNSENPYVVIIDFDDTNISNPIIHQNTVIIADYAFRNCDTIENVVIPHSVTRIGEGAFSSCRLLESVVIPDSVIEIGSYAFESCFSLENISIGNNLQFIGRSAFSYCDALVGTKYGNAYYLGNEENPYLLLYKWAGNGIESVEINDKTKFIYDKAFYKCTNLKSIFVPDSVVSIGDTAFAGCENLESVILSNSVVTIGGSAFAGCENLKSIILSNSLVSIGDSAFYRCSLLENITLPDSLKAIGDKAFGKCTSLQSIIIPKYVDEMGSMVFEYCSDIMVYCRARTKGEGWDYYWNDCNTGVYASVRWNYKG